MTQMEKVSFGLVLLYTLNPVGCLMWMAGQDACTTQQILARHYLESNLGLKPAESRAGNALVSQRLPASVISKNTSFSCDKRLRP